MAFIEVIEPEDSEGALREIYESLREKRGKLAKVHKIQSLHPESITAHMDLYMAAMFSRSPLSRAQREMVAVVVSSCNECEYCRLHHGEALNHYWKDRERVERLWEDFEKAELDETDLLLCRLARKLTEVPGEMSESDIGECRSAGLSDRAILDLVLVVSYFNFVNRMVMGLGVEPDEEEVRGYRY